MSVTGYFSNVRDFRMPKADSQPDPLGIRWQGHVLEGKGGVRETLDALDTRVRQLALLQNTPPRRVFSLAHLDSPPKLALTAAAPGPRKIGFVSQLPISGF